MTTVINLFAGPGAGKSTIAAGIFFELKTKNIKCELVTEYAKDMTYEERQTTLRDQLYMLAKQNQRIRRLQNKVDYIITDSPLLLGLAYTPEDYYEHFQPLVLEIFNSYDNLNVYINRVKPYQNYGRNQTEVQAKEKDRIIYEILRYNKLEHIIVAGDLQAPSTIIDYLGLID